MKKMVFTLLAFVLIVSLFACGSKDGASETSSSTVSQESSATSGEKQTISAASSASSTTTSANPASSSSSSAGRATSSVKPAPSSAKSTKEQNASSNQKKILVAYFSWSGNTRQIANMIHNKIGGDIFEIKTKTPYSSDYNTVVNQAQQEQKQNARPVLASSVKNMSDYNMVFLGYPNWWSDLPMPVFTFIESYNFSGKTVIPFCTNGGGGFGRGVNSMKSKMPGAKFLDGFEINGSSAASAQDDVNKWLDSLHIN